MKLKLINKVYKCPICKKYLLIKAEGLSYDYVCDGPCGCHAKFIDEDKEDSK